MGDAAREGEWGVSMDGMADLGHLILAQDV
jgi:hypothetical protein